MTGAFTISLDFELHWGGFEKWRLEEYRQYFLNTRQVIPQVLTRFQQHEIHVTWATVGMLFHETRDQLMRNCPTLRPAYHNKTLSAYDFIETHGIGDDERDDPFHFAHSLILKIKDTPFQELGTHTFSHFYCNEPGQNVQQFQEDLRSAKRAATAYGVQLKSLVFPRNQFNDQYLMACYQEGIRSVRSNPLDWFWNIESTQQESLWKRLNRGVDAYLPVGKKNTYRLESIGIKPGFPLCIPASRLLRPYRPSELFLNDMKISRIKAEMTAAAKAGEAYHLWWHPHNFGNHPQQSLSGLEKILEHFDYCRKRWQMQSLNMSEIVSLLSGNK